MLRRNASGIVILVLVASLFATTALASANGAENPLYSNKEILNYLFWTRDEKLQKDVAGLQATLGLSEDQMSQLKDWGLRERISVRTLQNKKLTSVSFNTSVAEVFNERNVALQGILGKKYKAFEEWVSTWWSGERNYRKTWLAQRYGTFADIDRISGIFATQYEPNTPGAYEVALPDKYIKFANLGWWSDIPDEIEDTYGDPPYEVNVYNPDTDLAVLGVSVDEVGPWNEDDNYWDSADGDNPRRFGSDLDLGTPAAYAAYYDDWNDGKDFEGDTVTNPAGIDLTPDVAADLGLSLYENAWVDVRYEYIP